MVDFDLKIHSVGKFEDYFNTLCNLIDLETDEDNQPSQQEIAKVILNIIKNIVKKRLGDQAGELNILQDERWAIDTDSQVDHCAFLLG